MDRVTAKHKQRASRRRRIRAKVKGSADRPRLTVFRSNKFIYAQVIDDDKGETVVSSNTRDLGNPDNAAEALGKDIAQKAQKAGITKIVFDRSGYRFTGTIKKIAEAAREGGLEF